MNLEDYSKYYIQGSDHYLIPRDVFKELFNEMVNWKEESIELNKKYENAVANYETTMSEKVKLETQQKEFIKWLEDKINFYKINMQGYSMNLLEEILQKYKSIIGDGK